ncbi:hypothetical protein MASR2M41_09870 [Flammeovirgaceae bacterium]
MAKIQKVEPDRIRPKRIKGAIADSLIISQAQKVIDEASWIGIINGKVKAEYLKLASFSRINFEAVREILRKEKRLLTDEFEKHQSQKSLDQLVKTDPKRYCLLYRAKYLKQPQLP